MSIPRRQLEIRHESTETKHLGQCRDALYISCILFRRFGFYLTMYVWDQSHEAGVFDRSSDLALVFATDASVASGLHATIGIDELFQQLGILIVDMSDLVLGEKAVFGHTRLRY
jgi:hypothetical protein